MATVQYYMNYVIYFKDVADYNFAIGVAGSNLLALAPRDAASLFGIPFPYPSGDVSTIPKGINFIFPYTPGAEFLFPGSTGIFVDDTVLTTTVPGQAGNPPSIFPAGPDGVFTWSGNITLMPGAGVSDDPPPIGISQRRWIGGRELSNLNEGGSGIAIGNYSADASRVIGGAGFFIRGTSNSSAWLRTVDQYRTGLQPQTSWERFYFRARRLPITNNMGMWECHGFPSNAAGFGIKYTTAGDVHGYNISLSAVETDAGTIFTPVIDQWYRVDIFLKYDRGVGTSGIIKIFIDGVFTYSFTATNGVGMNGNDYHTNSELGLWTAPADSTGEIDFDDWICADLPANVDPDTLLFLDDEHQIDWLLGSHVRVHHNVSVSQTNWTPANAGVGTTNQDIVPSTRAGTSELVSTTSGATLEGLTDAPLQSENDTLGVVLGAVAAIVTSWNLNTGGTDGQLGYKKAGGAAVLETQNQQTTQSSQTMAYLPSGMIIPDEIAPWSVVHTKSADGNTDRTYMLLSVVEYLGVWGPEDDPLFEFPISRLSWLHNFRYYNTQYGYFGSRPDLPVFAVGGTYTGDGATQEFTLPGPCHFLFIRGLTSSGSSYVFFGAAANAHSAASRTVIPNIRVWFDAINGLFKFSVTGAANSDLNESGITYQYIAFCDPGMRFNLCGAYGHGNTIATPVSNPLIVSDFLPDLGFVQSDAQASISTQIGLYGRGPGTPATQANPLDGTAQQANGFTFAAGVLDTYSGMNSGAGGQAAFNYSLWRVADGGAAGCENVMIQIVTYTGDGNASKVITLTPTSGRFPLFVLVFPGDGTASSFFRDPSHTGTNSANFDSLANSTTAITAVGIDQITVGLALNVNGRPYNVFVICGDTAGMNNGTFYPTYCITEEPWEDPEPPLGDINIVSDGGLILNGITPLTLLKDVSGIYTLVEDLHKDVLIDRAVTPADEIDVKIPDPTFKTGYVGG